jgi:hypothetical protein
VNVRVFSKESNMFQWIADLKLEPKEVGTIAVALVSVCIATANWIYTMRSKSREAWKAANSDFNSAVKELIELRYKREEAKRELGKEWGLNKHSAARISIADQREFVLSNALHLLSKYKLEPSSIGYTMLAANIAESGRPLEAVPLYKKAVDVASNDTEEASSRRVYGRALILVGQFASGREEMVKAAALFSHLSKRDGYDQDVMRNGYADTLRRLIWTALYSGYHEWIRADLDEFTKSIPFVRDAERRQSLNESEIELRAEVERILSPKNQSP